MTESDFYTAFDIETTGLDPVKDKIVEIGAVKFDSRGITSRFSVLIDPGIPMPPEAGRVNNITDEMLAGKPSLGEVLPDFIRFSGGTILVAHNAPFDCGFINEALKSLYGKNPSIPFPALPNQIVNTLTLAREKFPGLPSYKLGALAAFLNIDAKDAHRAEDDARVCMEIFLKCAGKLG